MVYIQRCTILGYANCKGAKATTNVKERWSKYLGPIFVGCYYLM